MKKYTLLALLSLVGFVILFHFYEQGVSEVSADHTTALDTFRAAKHLETSLDKNVLMYQNYLLFNYDSIVETSGDVEASCENLLKINLGAAKSMQEEVGKYCSSIKDKINDVEYFKSKNSILRNSISFLQEKAVYLTARKKKKEFGFGEQQLEGLVYAALTYSMAPTQKAKKNLERMTVTFKRTQDTSGFDEAAVTYRHARKILNEKEVVDQLSQGIFDSSSKGLLASLREHYLSFYEKSEVRALYYRKILFAVSLLLFLIIVGTIIKMFGLARELKYANENLEARVEERTKELLESQEIIVKKQKTLVSAAKMAALGRMAGGVAHEINTPLSVIKMRMGMLEKAIIKDDIDPVKIIQYANIVQKTVDRIAEITMGLLIVSRNVRGEACEITRLSDIVLDTVSFCQERFEKEQISFCYPSLEVLDKIQIECRSVDISQALQNLLNNSIDAIGSGEDRWVDLLVIDKKDSVEIRVVDSGTGIAEDIQEKMMEPFFTSKGIGGGMGMGLSVSLGIIGSHHGELKFDRDDPHTCFVITLPKSQEEVSSKSQAS